MTNWYSLNKCLFGEREKMRGSFSFCAVMAIVMWISLTASADNPIIQTNFTSDPAPMVYNGRVYIYTTHDSDNASGSYVITSWRCYSSKDMVNWTDHGVMLTPRNVTWSTAHDADAIQVIFRNGKFYFYINTTASDGVSIGVAVSTSPIGPFKDTLGMPLIAASKMTGCNATHGWRGLDPTVYIDDDGQAYLYWGNNVLYWVKLNEDMISYSGSISCMPQNDPAFGPDYEEGPWFYKRNKIYYLVYPSTASESIHYTTSPGPTGPWTYGGLIMPVETGKGSSMTIHPGVCDFGGNSYFFYHNGALPGGGSYKRSVCLEKFTYNTDGGIPKISGTTAGVTTGVGNLNPFDTNEAETICWGSGVKTEVCSEGGMDVDSIHNGDYIKVKAVNFASGAKSFDARVASATSGGSIEIHLDTTTGPLAGTCAVAGTTGWQTWETKQCTISGATGIHDLFFKFTGGSGLLFNFNWWKFTPAQTEIDLKETQAFEGANAIHATVEVGKTRTLRLDFSRRLLHEDLFVGLFDLTGRLVMKLSSGQLSFSRLSLPLDNAEIRTGAYIVRVALNEKMALTKTITIY